MKKMVENEENFEKCCNSSNLLACLTPKIFEKMFSFIPIDNIRFFKKLINKLFFYSLISNFQTNLIALLLDHEIFTKMLNLDLFCLLFHYINKIKDNYNGNSLNNNTNSPKNPSNYLKNPIISSFSKNSLDKLHWRKILNIKSINLTNHPRLSTTSYKILFLSILEQFFFEMKLQTPEVLHTNAYFSSNFSLDSSKFDEINQKLKEKVISFVEEIVKTVFSTDLCEYDDFIGEILLELIKIMPNLQRINFNGMNLNDDFCEKLSSILLEKYFSQGKSLSLSLCRNFRITNVGLKYLYLVYKIARIQQINATLKVSEEDKGIKENCCLKKFETKDKEKFHSLIVGYKARFEKFDEYLESSHIQKYKRNSLIMNKGLGVFCVQNLREFFSNKTLKFCYECEHKVCSNCHSFHNLKKKCLNRSVLVSTDCKVLQNMIKKQLNRPKFNFFFRGLIRFFMIFSMIFQRIFEFIILISKKLREKLDKTLKRLTASNKISKLSNCFLKFFLGSNEDLSIKPEEFKFSEMFFLMNTFLGKSFFICIFRINFLLFPIFCTIPVTFFSNMNYSYLCFFIYSLYLFFFESILSYKLIKIANLKRKVVKSFSILAYGNNLIVTLINKYSSYANFVFVIQNFRNQNFLISIFSLCFLSWFHFYCLLLFIETAKAVCKTCKKHSNSPENFDENYEKTIISIAENQQHKRFTKQTPAHNINIASRTAILLQFDCLASLLDQFSTKNAVQIYGLYVPEIIVISFGKCFFYDMPNFFLQIYLYSSLKADGFESIVTIILTILSMLKSFKKLLQARATKIDKFDLNSLEFELESLENVKEESKEFIKIRLVH